MSTYTGTASSVFGSSRLHSQADWTPGSPSSNVSLSLPVMPPADIWSNYLFFQAFGLAVPLTETIVGVTFTYLVSGIPVSAGTASDSSLLMQLSGPQSSDLAQPATLYSTSSQTSQVRGGVSNLWGLTSVDVTPAQVNSGSFGFLLSAQINASGAQTVNVSAVSAATVTITTIATAQVAASIILADDDERIPSLRITNGSR
jgi:hypothetical protein